MQEHAAVQQSFATAKPHPAALHSVHEVFVLGLSVHLPPQEDTVPPEQPPAAFLQPASPGSYSSPAGRLAGGRQDAAQGGPALPEEAEAHQDRAKGLHSKVGGRKCVAGWVAAKTAGLPSALGDDRPALLSGCHLKPQREFLFKKYFPDTFVFSKVKKKICGRRISSQTFTFLKVSESLI